MLHVKCFPWYGIAPTVLSRYAFNILRNKISQYLAFIWWMPEAMYETGFWLTFWVVYIYIYALASALNHHIVSIQWVGFYSISPAVTRTGGIYPNRLFIRILYYTFIDRSLNLHAFKHVNCLKIIIDFQYNPCTYDWLL